MIRTGIAPFLLALAFAHPAHAAETATAAGPAHPTMQDMQKWKSDFLAQFQEVVYLDTASQAIAEPEFFKRIVEQRLAFNIERNSGTPERLTLRLLAGGK